MKLIIIKENFDTKRILFRESKNCIKISYDINYISMIGITLKLAYDYLIDKETFLILKVNEKDKILLNKIDEYFNKSISNYDKMLINNTIKVKKHNEYKRSSEKVISITMNSIKKNNNGMNKVQIFSI
jgi:hypothetical protein